MVKNANEQQVEDVIRAAAVRALVEFPCCRAIKVECGVWFHACIEGVPEATWRLALVPGADATNVTTHSGDSLDACLADAVAVRDTPRAVDVATAAADAPLTVEEFLAREG